MTSMPADQSSTPPTPRFNPEAAHQNKPKLRPVRAFPANVGGQQAMGLADARQISDRMVMTSPAFQIVLPLMDGLRTVDEIVAQVGRGLTRPIVEPLIAQLDEAGLLFGPVFDGMLTKMRKDFDSSPTLPPAASAEFAEGLLQQEIGQEAIAAMGDAEKTTKSAEKIRGFFDQCFQQALENEGNPTVESLPRAIFAPHLDYSRGWLNYAHAYGRMRGLDAPDRIVILGTNHFGEGTGVVGCDKGYESPLGTCPADTALIEALRKSLGDGLFANRFDHEREHSIELHIPWIQHVFGTGANSPKVFAALVHDPVVNGGESYDGKGVSLDAFVAALKGALASLPGRTLIVSSADLSHVGPDFGDQVPLAGEEAQATEFRQKVIMHDQELLGMIRDGKIDELIASMAWQQNQTRWCSVGNIAATMKTLDASEVELFNYAGAMDQQGMTLVTCFAGMVA
jgi:AmmeMemoRadiSam system protein B